MNEYNTLSLPLSSLSLSSQLFGHNQVSILDGGLPKWLAKGGPVVSGPHPNVKVYDNTRYITYCVIFQLDD